MRLMTALKNSLPVIERLPTGRDKVKAQIFEDIGYHPTEEQARAHFSDARVKLVLGGWRGGKSYSGAMDMVGEWPDIGLMWVVGADYDQCRGEGGEFDYLADYLAQLNVVSYLSMPKEGQCSMVLGTGGKIVTKSAQHPEKLGKEAPDRILVCEVQLLDYATWLRLRARVAEKRGKIWASGTLESSLGWVPELYNRWQIDNPDNARSFSLPSWDNLAVFPGGENDPEIISLRNQFSTDRFLERFGGVPCPPRGLVLKEFRVTLHCGDFAFDDKLPVYLWVDPGYAKAYAVEVAQIKNDVVYAVDEVYEQGLTTEEVIQVCETRPWWKMVAGGAIDIAGRQHHAGPSAEEVWRTAGKVILNSQPVGIVDGIDRLRNFLKPNPITGLPSFFVDNRCRGLIAEMGGCPNPIEGLGKWLYKTDREGRVFSEVPDDKNNHACKAVIYGLVDRFGIGPRGIGRSFMVKSRGAV